MKYSELQSLSLTELQGKLHETANELLQVRAEHSTLSLKNTAQIRKIRKTIARINTALALKQHEAQLSEAK